MTTDTPLLCLICSSPDKPRRATPGYRTCDRCVERIREALSDIPDLYAVLGTDEAFMPAVNPGARRGPGFGSRSPANDQAIALTDPRTTWTEEDRIHNPLVVVESWARMVREDVGEQPPPGNAYVRGEVELLIRRLDFITRQEWVDEFWLEIREVRDQLGAFNGDRKPLPVGKCPSLLKTTGKECGTPLYAPLQGDVIKCRNKPCGREWTRREWMHLGRTLRVVAAESDGGSAA